MGGLDPKVVLMVLLMLEQVETRWEVGGSETPSLVWQERRLGGVGGWELCVLLLLFHLVSKCSALSTVLTIMGDIPSHPPTTLRVGAVGIATLQVRRRGFREGKSLCCGDTAPLR